MHSISSFTDYTTLLSHVWNRMYRMMDKVGTEGGAPWQKEAVRWTWQTPCTKDRIKAISQCETVLQALTVYDCTTPAEIPPFPYPTDPLFNLKFVTTSQSLMELWENLRRMCQNRPATVITLRYAQIMRIWPKDTMSDHMKTYWLLELVTHQYLSY